MSGARHAIEAFSGTRLRELRRQRGLSQEQLARLVVAGSDRPAGDGAVSRERLKILAYEQGTRRPRAEGLHALAAALGVDARDLLDPAAPVTFELLRALRRLTQGQVAVQLGVSQARYSQLESGAAPIDPARRDQLARILGITAAELQRLRPSREQE